MLTHIKLAHNKALQRELKVFDRRGLRRSGLGVARDVADAVNPPELGVMEASIRQVKNGRVYIIPASPDTRGHGTTGAAKFWKDELAKLLAAAPRRAM